MLCKDIPDVTDMEALGAALARECPSGAKIFLQGQLGAGKTTLVRGFLHELGYQGIVKSPTYTLVEPYFLPDVTVYHFDLYRLNDPGELEAIGLRDYFDRDAICLVEWPENAGAVMGEPDIKIEIEHQPAGRKVTLSALNLPGKTAIDSLA